MIYGRFDSVADIRRPGCDIAACLNILYARKLVVGVTWVFVIGQPGTKQLCLCIRLSPGTSPYQGCYLFARRTNATPCMLVYCAPCCACFCAQSGRSSPVACRLRSLSRYTIFMSAAHLVHRPKIPLQTISRMASYLYTGVQRSIR
jgi:hypothetical protein